MELHPTHQMVWRSSTHKWGKELNQLNTIQIWEGSFTLYDPYFVQSALSGEKIGMNTSKFSHCSSKVPLPKVFGKWQKSKLSQTFYLSQNLKESSRCHSGESSGLNTTIL